MKFNIEVEVSILAFNHNTEQFVVLSTEEETLKVPLCIQVLHGQPSYTALNLVMKHCDLTEEWVEMQLNLAVVTCKEDTMVINYGCVVPMTSIKQGYWKVINPHDVMSANLIERIINT